MRLSVFIAKQTSTQLLIDLQKIYSDDLPKEELSEQSVNELINSPTTRLFMTMFNERHIGAVKVTVKNSQASLSQLCIREITRRRGIGKNLLREVQKQLVSEGIKEIQYNLTEVKDELQLITQNNIAFKAL